jgi:hypothetical protein
MLFCKFKKNRALAVSPLKFNVKFVIPDSIVQAAEMKCFISTGVKRQEKLTNEAFKKTLKMNSQKGTISE